MELVKKVGENTPDNLVAGICEKIVESAKLEKQGVLKRGTLIGKTTENKLYVLGSNSATIPFGVLCDDIDTNENVNANLYYTGIFNKNKIILDAGSNLEDYEFEFRKLGIFFTSLG